MYTIYCNIHTQTLLSYMLFCSVLCMSIEVHMQQWTRKNSSQSKIINCMLLIFFYFSRVKIMSIIRSVALVAIWATSVCASYLVFVWFLKLCFVYSFHLIELFDRQRRIAIEKRRKKKRRPWRQQRETTEWRWTESRLFLYVFALVNSFGFSFSSVFLSLLICASPLRGTSYFFFASAVAAAFLIFGLNVP